MTDKLRFHPSEYVLDWIDRDKWTMGELSLALDMSTNELQDFFRGESPVDDVISSKLSEITGVSKVTWISLQEKYDRQ